MCVGDTYYVFELAELKIGTWEIVSKMKGELTMIIDEQKRHVQCVSATRAPLAR